MAKNSDSPEANKVPKTDVDEKEASDSDEDKDGSDEDVDYDDYLDQLESNIE